MVEKPSSNSACAEAEEFFSYCPHCGIELETTEIEPDKFRRRCPGCAWVQYLNPIPVVVGVAHNSTGEILLGRRNLPPARGEWALPGGFMEAGESPEQTCLRELFEETALEAAQPRLLGVYSEYTDYYGELLIVAYAVKITGGSLQIDKTELQEAEFVSPATLPAIPFPSHLDAISRYQQLTGQR